MEDYTYCTKQFMFLMHMYALSNYVTDNFEDTDELAKTKVGVAQRIL